MPIQFNCAFCGRLYRVAEASAGKRFKCKDCGTQISVPGDTSGLSFADTAEMRKLRNAPTEILSADRPRRSPPAQRNKPSDTAKIPDRPARMKPPTRKVEPEPEVKPPASKLPAGKLPGGLKSPSDLPKAATRVAQTRALPEAPKSRRLNFVFMLGALALIAGFFLPWINVGLEHFEGGLAGFEAGLKAADLAIALNLAGLYPDNAIVEELRTEPNSAFVFFALYLIPALALYAIIDDLRSAGKGKSHWWIRLLAALAPALAVGAIYTGLRGPIDAFMAAGGIASVDFETDAMISTIGPGAYTMLGGWLVVLLGVFIAPKVKKPDAVSSPAEGAPKARPKLPVSRKPEA